MLLGRTGDRGRIHKKWEQEDEEQVEEEGEEEEGSLFIRYSMKNDFDDQNTLRLSSISAAISM